MIGFFGKLPAHGDFVTRNVSYDFVDVWDSWLQSAITTSRERLGASWLDIYLTSSIWRFVLLGGICGEDGYAGILMPSVDRVGRYFPLTLVTPLPRDVNAFEVASSADEWFAAAEAVALHALDDPRVDADALHASAAAIASIGPLRSAADRRLSLRADGRGYTASGYGGSEASGVLAHTLLREKVEAYSLWWMAGADAGALSLVVFGLPPPEDFAQLLCGGSTIDESTVTRRQIAESDHAAHRPFPDRRPFKWSSVSRSETGNVREVNEDAYLELPDVGLWAVADGMGGHEDGRVASHMLIEALSGTAVPRSLSALVDDVEDRILQTNRLLHMSTVHRDRPRVVGCTVAALLARGSHCIGLWAGDSRIYRLRDGRLERMTRDHSEVEEARDRGETPDAADESVITRAVGAAEQLFLDLGVHELRHGDRFLICSDGLYRELAEEELRERLAIGTCEQACSALLNAALSRECADNVTAVVLECVGAWRSTRAA